MTASPAADLDAARAFVSTHGRLLDRRRLAVLLDTEGARVGGDTGGAGDSLGDAVLGALDAYRNSDGGYGWGLEPDLRAAESQPAGATHAFEALAEVAERRGRTTPHAVGLCGWLADHSASDGGLPFALPIADATGCAPFWVGADPATSTLQMTTQVAANAHRLARHDRSVAAHPWLAMATAWCMGALQAVAGAPARTGSSSAALHAYEVLFSLRFLDAVADDDPEATDLLERLASVIPADGLLPVAGGAAGEVLRPLDVAPRPDRPVRALFRPEVIEADLDHLAAAQQDDGGWVVDYDSYSAAAALEWRGYRTVHALSVLRANGRL